MIESLRFLSPCAQRNRHRTESVLPGLNPYRFSELKSSLWIFVCPQRRWRTKPKATRNHIQPVKTQPRSSSTRRIKILRNGLRNLMTRPQKI